MAFRERRTEDDEHDLGNVDERRFSRRRMLKAGLKIAGGAVVTAALGGVGLSLVAAKRRPISPAGLDTVAVDSIEPMDTVIQRGILSGFLAKHESLLATFETPARTLAEASRVRTKDGKWHVDLTFLPEWAGESMKPRSYRDVEPVTFRLRTDGSVEGVMARSHWNLIWAGVEQFRDPKKPEVCLSPGFHTPIFDLRADDWPNFIPQGGHSELLSRDTYLVQSKRIDGKPEKIAAQRWIIGSLEPNHPGRMQPWH